MPGCLQGDDCRTVARSSAGVVSRARREERWRETVRRHGKVLRVKRFGRGLPSTMAAFRKPGACST